MTFRIMVLVLSVAAIVNAVAAENTQSFYPLTVTAKGEHLAGSQVLFAVFDSEENYLQTPLKKLKAIANEHGEASVQFEQLSAGAYAVVAIKDVDSNGELNRDERGLPTEPLAFSNNPRLRRGPPKFAKAAVEHQAEQHIELVFTERRQRSVEADAGGLRGTTEPAL